jgi:protease-4
MKDRTILWVFVAFVLGFALPVCSCAGAGLLTLGALSRMAGAPAATEIGVGDAVAVLRLDGAISSGPEEYFATQGITPERVAELLEQASDPAIKAIVVRVNSPGGSVVASDEIYHALLDFDRPVVVWMDEVGVDVVVITSGPRKDFGSMFREMTEEEQALWREITDEIYEGFVEVVAQARDLPLGQVRKMADGRVYTGRQALELGLVDDVGTLEDAIAKAAELGGIEGEPRVIELRPTPSLRDLFYGVQTRSTVPTLDEILSWAGAPSVQLRFVGP